MPPADLVPVTTGGHLGHEVLGITWAQVQQLSVELFSMCPWGACMNMDTVVLGSKPFKPKDTASTAAHGSHRGSEWKYDCMI